MASYSPYQEDPVLLHRALLNCLRRTASSEDRRSYLCVMENIIAQKTGVPVKSPFFNLLQSSADEITRNLSYEVQQIKMEDQVDNILDNSPPEESGAMGNMVGDDEPIDLVNQNGRSSSESSGDDDEFIDLSELILNDPPTAIVNPTNLPEPDLSGFGIVNPNDINIIQPPLKPLELSIPTGVPVVTAPGVPLSTELLSPMNQTVLSFNNDTHSPIDHVPSPLSAVSRPPNGFLPHSRPPLSAPDVVTRPPMTGPDTVPLPNNVPAMDQVPPSHPAVSRPPQTSVPESRLPLAPADNFLNGVVDSSTVSPATRVPGLTNMDICNSVPQLPITLVRPKGFLPTSTPDTDSSQISQTSERDTDPLRKTRSTSSDQLLSRQESLELFPREKILSRQSTANSSVFSRQNSDYETRPLPRPGAGAISSDYSSDAFRRSSSEGGTARDNKRSSSSEGATITQPETHRGATVYRSKRITHLQLLAFLENTSLKAELKELGAFYMISSCDEPKYYNISLSGDRHTTSKAVELFTAALPADSTEYITEEVPIPVYQELKESGYLLQLLRQLYPSVDIKVDRSDVKQLTYRLSGNNTHVFDVVSLIKFMTSLPDKKFGMLLKLHSRLTNSPELIDRLINSAQNITKTPVLCLDCTKTEACKFLFVPGLCGTENQYKLQKHLNVLVEKFEQAESNESMLTPQFEVAEDPLSQSIVKYSFEELLIIRDKCKEPHKDLLEQTSLPIRLISKIDKS